MAFKSFRAKLKLDSQTILFMVVVVVLIYLVVIPLGMTIYGSLRDSRPGQPGLFTLANYVQAFGSGETYRALLNSLIFSGGASLLAFAMGTFLAWASQRTNTPGAKFLFFATLFPMFIPTVLMAISWIMLLSPEIGLINKALMAMFGLSRPLFNVYSLGGMTWVTAITYTPVAFLWMWPAFRYMDPSLEEAASMCGSSTARIFFNITLRLATPAVIATWLIVFVRGIEAFAIPSLLGLPKGIIVLSTEIYLATFRYPQNVNLASTYAMILILATLIGIIFNRKATSRAGMFVTVTGRGYRPRRADLGNWKYLTLAVCLVLVMILVGLPLFMLVWTSFMPYLQMPSLDGLRLFTADNYRDVFNFGLAYRAFANSVTLGIGSGVIVMIFTALAAWLVVRSNIKGKEIVDLLAFIPVAIPGLVVGLSLMWVYLTVPIPIYGTLWILLVAYLIRFLPYGMRLCYAAFNQIDKSLEEVSMVSGAGWGRTFVAISLPLLVPTLLVGFINVILNAFRELPSSIMLVMHGTEVVPTALYNLWVDGYTERMSAFGVLAIVILSLLVLVSELLGRKYGVKTGE